MTFRILHYSDIENAYDSPERIGSLANVIEELKDSNTLVAGTGDNLAPSVLSLKSEGEQALDFFDEVEPDVETIGNHDFDHGIESAQRVIDESPHKWVCANAVIPEGPNLDSSVLVEKQDYRTGIIGVTHPELGVMNPKASEIDVSDPVKAVRNEVAKLREKFDIDYTVVLAHLGGGTEKTTGGEELAKKSDVDVVLDGHKHERTFETIDGTVYTRPGQGGRYLGEVKPDERDVEFHDISNHTSDAKTKTSVAESLRERASKSGLTETVASVEKPIRCDRASVRAGESLVGNFVTDAYRWKADADIAVMAPAGIRKSKSLKGKIQTWDLIKLVPFENQLVVLEIRGEKIRDVLASVSVYHRSDMHDWYFGHISGASIKWDDQDNQIVEVRVEEDPIEDRIYTVATSEYFVKSNHLFPNLHDSDIAKRLGPQYEAVVEYARVNGVQPELEERIKKISSRNPDT